MLGAAVVDDVLVIAFMTVILASTGAGSSFGAVGLTLLQMVIVLILVGVVSLRLLPSVVEWAHRLRVSQGLLSLSVRSEERRVGKEGVRTWNSRWVTEDLK